MTPKRNASVERQLTRAVRWGAVIVVALAGATGLWLRWDRDPQFVMGADIFGMGTSTESAERDLARRYDRALLLARTAGVRVIETEPTPGPCPQGCRPPEFRSLTLRDGDDTRLTRVFLELQRAGAIASVPRYALLPRDSVLALLCASLVLGFATFERGRWAQGLPIATKTPLLVASTVAGLLISAALLADSRDLIARFAPIALLALALPLWALSEIAWYLRDYRNLRGALGLAGAIVASPVAVWLARYVSL